MEPSKLSGTGESERLTLADGLRLTMIMSPRRLSPGVTRALQHTQAMLIMRSFRLLNQITVLGLPILILLFVNFGERFDQLWMLFITSQMVHVSLIARWIGRAAKRGRLQMRKLALITFPSAVMCGVVSGSLPGLVMQEAAIGGHDTGLIETLALLTSVLWMMIAAIFWLPTMLPHVLTIKISYIVTVLLTFIAFNNPQGGSIAIWLANLGFVIVPIALYMTVLWFRDRLDRHTLRHHYGALADRFAEFQEGARDWHWRTDAQLLVCEMPPERIEHLPVDCQPVCLDGLFMPFEGDHAEFERALLNRAALDGLELRRIDSRPDAEPIWWRLRGGPLYRPDGSLRGYFLTGSEITAEYKLREAEKRIETLNADVRGSVMALTTVTEAARPFVKGCDRDAQTLRAALNDARRAMQPSEAPSKAQQCSKAEPAPGNGNDSPPTLLMLETDSLRQRMALRHLTREGYHVITVNRADQLADALDEGPLRPRAVIIAADIADQAQNSLNFLVDDILAPRRLPILWRGQPEAERLGQCGVAIAADADGKSLLDALRSCIGAQDRAA